MDKPLNLVELLTDKRYKEMDEQELEYVIDYQLNYNDYDILKGSYAENKAKNLYSYFRA